MTISVDTYTVKDCNDNIVSIQPTVRIDIEASENFNLSKLRLAKNTIEDTLYKELNMSLEFPKDPYDYDITDDDKKGN